MNKDIYSILNSTKNDDHSYGRLNDEEVNDIMERFNSENKPRKSTSIKKIVAVGSTAIAAAACLAVFIASPAAKKLTETPMINEYSGSNENTENIAADESSFSIVNNSFFITADAAETEPPKDMYISMDHAGGACIPYSGSYFYVKGTNIKNVSVSIDKGALYKYKYKTQTDHTFENCEYIGNEYTELFNGNHCYGFYFSEENFEKHEQECDGYTPKAWHMCYDDFNGAKLTISAEYLDGQTESITYTLKSGMIELDTETMKPNGNISDGSTPYIYCIYFE